MFAILSTLFITFFGLWFYQNYIKKVTSPVDATVNLIQWLALIILWIVILLFHFTTNAKAHHAPSGWEYPYACCRDSGDCQMIHSYNVKLEINGYTVILNNEEHTHVSEGPPKSFFFPFILANGVKNSNIKISGDKDFHVCIGKWDNDRCLYVPENEIGDLSLPLRILAKADM